MQDGYPDHMTMPDRDLLELAYDNRDAAATGEAQHAENVLDFRSNALPHVRPNHRGCKYADERKYGAVLARALHPGQ